MTGITRWVSTMLEPQEGFFPSQQYIWDSLRQHLNVPDSVKSAVMNKLHAVFHDQGWHVETKQVRKYKRYHGLRLRQLSTGKCLSNVKGRKASSLSLDLRKVETSHHKVNFLMKPIRKCVAVKYEFLYMAQDYVLSCYQNNCLTNNCTAWAIKFIQFMLKVQTVWTQLLCWREYRAISNIAKVISMKNIL